MPKELLLFSGGMDSTALAFERTPDLLLSVDYGQQSWAGELGASSRIADHLSIPHETVRCDVSALGSGDLAGTPPADCAPVSEWWPFRNQFLVTVGAMTAIGRGLSSVVIGCVKSDSRHADGTLDFIERLNRLLVLQEGGITLIAPAIGLTTVELLAQSHVPNEVLDKTFSCHTSEYPCGMCSGCSKALRVRHERSVDS